ncbi:hypothetical protein J1614_009618 [Plenodomus biglobosus]|nr:hypothetical protein J1614_009618 [Plenodomus biglobosus]
MESPTVPTSKQSLLLKITNVKEDARRGGGHTQTVYDLVLCTLVKHHDVDKTTIIQAWLRLQMCMGKDLRQPESTSPCAAMLMMERATRYVGEEGKTGQHQLRVKHALGRTVWLGASTIGPGTCWSKQTIAASSQSAQFLQSTQSTRIGLDFAGETDSGRPLHHGLTPRSPFQNPYKATGQIGHQLLSSTDQYQAAMALESRSTQPTVSDGFALKTVGQQSNETMTVVLIALVKLTILTLQNCEWTNLVTN